MSYTVQCDSCKDPERPRRVVQWRMGSCRDCCDDLISRHLEEFPDHQVSISGVVSERPFAGAQQNIQRLFGKRKSA